MFKKIAFICLLFVATPAFAVNYAISPYPVHGAAASLTEWQAALADLDEAKVTALLETKSWGELEPKAGDYNVKPLAHDINENAEKNRIMLLGFQLINTTRRDMPADLVNVAWDDPAMVTRFRALMAALKERNPVPPRYISIGNEADVYFQLHPKELAPYLAFFEKAAAAARDAMPGAKVGITVTFEGLRHGRGAIVQQLLAASEVAIFTYYPLIDLKPLPIENVGEHMDSMVKAAGTHDVVLQEIGYPTGALVESSEQKQAQFFKYAAGAIAQHEQIKFANIFALGDFSDKDCGNLTAYYGFDKINEDIRNKFSDFICTLGLKNKDGSAKLAWPVVKRVIQ